MSQAYWYVCPACGDVEPVTTGTSTMCGGVESNRLSHAEMELCREIIDRSNPADLASVERYLAKLGTRAGPDRWEVLKLSTLALAGHGPGHPG